MGEGVIEALVRRDRAFVLSGLAGLAALSWLYLFIVAAEMSGGMPGDMSDMAMASLMPWNTIDFALMFVMWAVMMVAMMIPSAAPMILLFAAIKRRGADAGRPVVSTGIFAAGYILIWTVFSAAATVAQWALEQAALLSSMMVSVSPYLGGGLLIAAGAYQMTPLKQVCLKHCRSPAHFLSAHWRKGPGGALRMGLEHGAFCLGCCWVLMGLLFVGGVMNLLWIAVIAGFVLLEKVVPRGVLVGRVTGGLLILAGLWMFVQA